MIKFIKVLAVIISWFIRDYDRFLDLAEELAYELFIVLGGREAEEDEIDNGIVPPYVEDDQDMFQFFQFIHSPEFDESICPHSHFCDCVDECERDKPGYDEEIS